MEPVTLLTPRWSCPQAFLEDLALELAIGEPAVGCRTVDLRPLHRRPRAAAWQFILRVLAQLSTPRSQQLRVPVVAERAGFRMAVRGALEAAQERSCHPVALLAHGAEHLQVDVAEDLLEAWDDYATDHPSLRRCVLLLGGGLNAPALAWFDGKPVELNDFGPSETHDVLGRMVGPRLAGRVGAASTLTGGMPALVEAVGWHARRGRRLASDELTLLSSMGTVVDEIRGAVDIIASDGRLAMRLDSLLSGLPVDGDPDLDAPLMLAGLARRVHGSTEDRICLRAPAIATLVA